MKLKKNQVKLFNKLIPFIKKTQDDRRFLVEGEGGSGKCHQKNTPILTRQTGRYLK